MGGIYTPALSRAEFGGHRPNTENGDLIGDACTRLKQIESLLKTGHADERLFWKES
jgi:hypothetical protein